ncbi:hypothetical protein J1605_000920 [Eschrichtius robustus]|uniref:Uncharacterized protein n=1 Tax=Eschrichtius robustus TaxID=9764 RepID=A0AB34GPG4_ESCRO|nr:hypothetical protein J1605_000920 [Eschrichtius robustus]
MLGPHSSIRFSRQGQVLFILDRDLGTSPVLMSSDTANHSASEKFPLEDYYYEDGGDGEDVDDDSDNGAYII